MIGLKFDLVDVKIDRRGLYSTLQSQRSPVADHIRAIGRTTVVLSKGFAGVKTGRLKRSIKMERDRTITNEYAVLVGSDVRHALVHHQGAKRHVITPRSPGGYLVFRGRSGGAVFTKRVNHPGHRRNEYLVRALRMAVRSGVVLG